MSVKIVNFIMSRNSYYSYLIYYHVSTVKNTYFILSRSKSTITNMSKDVRKIQFAKQKPETNEKTKAVGKISDPKKAKAQQATLRYSEEKKIFGNLIETSREKSKRLKLEAAGLTQPSVHPNVDSEFAWVSKMPGVKLVKISFSHTKNSSADIEKDDNKTKNISNNLHSQENDVSNPDISTKPGLVSNKIKIKDISEVVGINFNTFPIFKIEKSGEQLDDTSSLCKKDFKQFLRFPSVTKILTDTMSEQAKWILKSWKENMIAQLGQEGFDKYKKELLEDGKALHSCIASFLLKQDFQVPTHIVPTFDSLNNVFKDIGDVLNIETSVAHPKLGYKGIIDCIATHRGRRYLIDWKKSDKPKLTIEKVYDAPIQLAAYIGAVNSYMDYPFTIDSGLIIVAYTNGDPATIHEVRNDNLQKYWKKWLRKLQEYHSKHNTLLVP